MRQVTILWNQQVQTDRTIPNNKSDIIYPNIFNTFIAKHWRQINPPPGTGCSED